MSNNQDLRSSCREHYETAYQVHYKTKDLSKALGLYRNIMTMFPNSREADYSRMQIQNIVDYVVPKDDILNAQVDLLLAYFKGDNSADPVLTQDKEHADATTEQ